MDVKPKSTKKLSMKHYLEELKEENKFPIPTAQPNIYGSGGSIQMTSESDYCFSENSDDELIQIDGLNPKFMDNLSEIERKDLLAVFGYFDKAGFLSTLERTKFCQNLEFMPLTRQALHDWGLIDCSISYILENYDQDGHFPFSSFVLSYLKWLNGCLSEMKVTTQGYPWQQDAKESSWFKSTVAEHFTEEYLHIEKKISCFVLLSLPRLTSAYLLTVVHGFTTLLTGNHV